MSSSSSSHTKRSSKRRSTDAANRQRQQPRSPVVHLRPMISDLSAQVKSKVVGQVTKVEATMVGTFRATTWKDDSGQKTMIRRTGNDQQDSLRDQLKSLLSASLRDHASPDVIFIELESNDDRNTIFSILTTTIADLQKAYKDSGVPRASYYPLVDLIRKVSFVNSMSRVVNEFLDASDSPLSDLTSSELIQLVDYLKQDENSDQLIDVYNKMIENVESPSTTESIDDDQKAFYFGVEAAYFLNLDKQTKINRNIPDYTLLSGADTSKSDGKIWQGKFADGDDRVWVIKRLLEEKPRTLAVVELGINPKFPRILDRSMMYSEIGRNSKEFIKLVPETTFGYIDLDDGNGTQLVQMIEKVGGEKPETARQWLKRREGDHDNEKNAGNTGRKLSDVEKGVFARDLTRMQYLDYLMSQVDRQIGNYMVEVDENDMVTGLKAIDNDFSFSSEDVKLQVQTKFESEGETNRIIISGLLALELPPLADKATQDFFNSITVDSIKKMANGRLTQKQFAIMSTRLEDIKKHLAELEDDDGIVQNDGDWKTQYSKLRLAKGVNVETYFDVLVVSDAPRKLFEQDGT